MDQGFKPEDSERAELFYLQHDGTPDLCIRNVDASKIKAVNWRQLFCPVE